jgi:hypothetical protein
MWTQLNFSLPRPQATYLSLMLGGDTGSAQMPLASAHGGTLQPYDSHADGLKSQRTSWSNFCVFEVLFYHVFTAFDPIHPRY